MVGRGPHMYAFSPSGCRVKPRRPHQTGPPGFTRQTQELQTCTFHGPGASNTTKIPREDPREGRKERILWREREQKARNFGPPTLRAPTFSGFGPLPFGPPPFRPPLGLAPGLHEKNQTSKNHKKKQFKKIQTINTKNPNN